MTDIRDLMGVTDASSLGILSPAFEVVVQMADTQKHIKLGQKRCKLAIQRAALIVKEVHDDLQKGRISKPNISKLCLRLEEVQTIFQKLAEMSFLKALIRFEVVNNSIEQANHCLTSCSQLFQIEHRLRVQNQVKAAKLDRDSLLALLNKLTGNYEEIRRHFGLDDDEQEDQAMAVMERALRNTTMNASDEDMPMELQIMQKSLECIKTTTRKSVPKYSNLLITDVDLDYCDMIGRGGFATVRRAKFRGMTVAVKTLNDARNVGKALEREIEIWSKLRHDHIVPFYGASTLTSPPFIVSRYMQNGNLVQYLAATPNADRTQLILEVSLGMYYLHEEQVVHGDLKGLNVLVDDSGKACITDFGLSRVCSSGASRTGTSIIAGTLRYLAPEVLKGQALSFETDVYAFGMLIYEVFAREVPFIREPDHLVLEGRLELRRPTSNNYGFDDARWQLLSECISRKPSARPGFELIQARLDSMKTTRRSAQANYSDATPYVNTDWRIDTTSVSSNTMPPADLTNWAVDTDSMVVNCTDQSGYRGEPEQPRPYHKIISPQQLPLLIQVTHKHFNVKFSVFSGEPGVYLDGNNTAQWQPIRAKKRSIMSEETNRFSYKNSTVKGTSNSWELNGNDVTLYILEIPTVVCHFSDNQVAQEWFGLQLSHARGENVGDWGMAVGDWFHTEKSWRRLVQGKLQQADLVDSDPDKVPDNRSWKDGNLPKRCTIDHYSGDSNCLVYFTNPSKQSGRFCCRLDGRAVIFETYRQQGDKRLMTAREETYPSEEYAEATFAVIRASLEKSAGNNRPRLLPF